MEQSSSSNRTETNESDDKLINPGKGLLVCVLSLVGIGLIFIYSSSYVWSMLDQEIPDGLYLFRRQLFYVCVSLLIMMAVSHIDFRWFADGSVFLYGFSLLLLIAVLIPGIGKEYYGARRWLRFGPVGFQPSELAKLSVILITAWFAARQGREMDSFLKGFLFVLLLIGIPASLIFMEPDLGTGAFVVGLGVLVSVAGGMRLMYLVPAGATALPAMAFLFWQKFPHFRERLLVFMNPQMDPLGTGHQIRQSLIALGSGGRFGEGLGRSMQKLFFLPQQNSDFIFSVIGEELGFLGTSMVTALFLGVVWFGFRIAMNCRDRFGRLVAIGITSCLGFQAAFNIAVVTASFPTKGMPLPFISFGGSSMVMSMLMVGILLSIHQGYKTDGNDLPDPAYQGN